jgi:hypothetical protein
MCMHNDGQKQLYDYRYVTIVRPSRVSICFDFVMNDWFSIIDHSLITNYICRDCVIFQMFKQNQCSNKVDVVLSYGILWRVLKFHVVLFQTINC